MFLRKSSKGSGALGSLGTFWVLKKFAGSKAELPPVSWLSLVSLFIILFMTMLLKSVFLPLRDSRNLFFLSTGGG